MILDKLVRKIFDEKEILLVEKFYCFSERKKIITFVPFDFLEKLTLQMSNAGAGLIGNYEVCSFRTEGTGTFKPNEKAKPFSGKKNFLSYEKEFKLEMECDVEVLNKVIDAFIKNHPYEEPVYEIYDFRRRDKKDTGITVSFKNKIKLSRILAKLNSQMENGETEINHEVGKIVLTPVNVTEGLISSARVISCGCIVKVSKKNYKLFKI